MKPLKRLTTVLLLILLLIVALGFYLPGFLSVDKPVESNTVLIESWVSHREIEQVVDQFAEEPGSMFFVIGQILPESNEETIPVPSVNSSHSVRQNNGIWIYANSSLEVIFPTDHGINPPDTIQIIVEAKGQEAARRYAYFNLVINGNSIGGAFTTEEYAEYAFQWVTSGQIPKTLYVNFINDLNAPGSDRNLNVRSVTVNGVRVDCNNSNTALTRNRSTLTTGYVSYSDQVADYIIQLGVPADKVIPVAFLPPERNLTFTAATRFKKFAEKRKLKSFNVLSTGIHSRRTWLTYRKVFGKRADVGIINYNSNGTEYNANSQDQSFAIHLLDESLAYLVNWFQLLLN